MSGRLKTSSIGTAKARLVVTLAAALAGFACAAPGSKGIQSIPEISVGQEAAGSTVRLLRGQRLTVSLAGNPTTGYQWEVAPEPENILKQEGAPAYTPEGGALGAGGVYRFAFRAAETGRAQLRFAYRRGFEPGAPPARSFELTVVVGE